LVVCITVWHNNFTVIQTCF